MPNMPNMPAKQNIMTEGPGLRERVRESNATLNSGVESITGPAAPVKPSPVDRVNPKGAPFGSRGKEKRMDVSGMTKELGTLHKGTDYVPKTGNYKLKEGEAVTPAEKNPMNPYSKITEGDKKPAKALKSIHTRKAKDGSYIHEHHHHHPAHPMEEHTSKDMDAMKEHMAENAPKMVSEQPAEPSPAGQTGAEAQGAALGMTQ